MNWNKLRKDQREEPGKECYTPEDISMSLNYPMEESEVLTLMLVEVMKTWQDDHLY